MLSPEFALIKRFFQQPTDRADVVAGVGDDAAILRPAPDSDVVVSTDTLIEGVHFPHGTAPEAVGHKALAVNLSDLAAMGADPAWVTLALTLPQIDHAWIEDFCTGWFALARRFDVALVGGDTTRGPLSLTVQAMGTVPRGGAIRRVGAQVGDDIYVTGTLGDAGAALALMSGRDAAPRSQDARLRSRLDMPFPRISVGRELRGLASAAIDVSDGLIADLGQIMRASGVGGIIDVEQVPMSTSVSACIREGHIDWSLPLVAGDDYELVFTAAPRVRHAIEHNIEVQDCPLTRVGTIVAGSGVTLQRDGIEIASPGIGGFDHFSASS